MELMVYNRLDDYHEVMNCTSFKFNFNVMSLGMFLNSSRYILYEDAIGYHSV